jgi:hypothetical protein
VNNDLSSEIEKLIEYKPSLQQLLMACPYDVTNSIDERMTRDLFLARLFHCDESLESLSEELARRMTSKIQTSRVTLITGYNGVGKSTFLWYFMDQHPDIDHHYVNFHSCGADDPIDEPLTKVIRDEVTKMDLGDQVRCIRAIKNHWRDLGRVFSPQFLKCIRKVEDSAITEEFIHDNIEHVKAVDMLLIYLMMLFLNPSSKDLQAVYFDNLDAAGIDYLCDDFRITFGKVLLRAVRLASHHSWYPSPVHFTRRYRFVFCLRDASSAIFNAHVEDSLGPTIKCMAFRINMSPEFYRGILRKRLDFIAEILGEEPDIRAVSNTLLEFVGDRAFVEPALVDLFNSDYRKLAYGLLVIAQTRRSPAFLDRTNRYYEYGTRGMLMRGVVLFLREHGYLKNHIETQFDPDKHKHGYFHHMRMVLNVILNSSQGSILEHTSDPAQLTGNCTLYELARSLKGVYPYSEILQTVAKCFLYHEGNWVQLLSIYKKPVLAVDAFAEEEQLLIELDHLLDRESFMMDENTRQRSYEIIKQLDRIGLKITPAGISYLKYLNTHFEYYSVFASPQSPALFEIHPQSQLHDEDGDGDRRYQFEEVIDLTFRRFAEHFYMMRKFYLSKFEAEMGYTPLSFRRSEYSFKYIGDRPRTMGMFHSSRVMYSHIDYLENYRLYALSSFELDPSEARLINERLVERIGRYVTLLRRSHDDSPAHMCEVFGKQISKIKASKYSDMTTKINV